MRYSLDEERHWVEFYRAMRAVDVFFSMIILRCIKYSELISPRGMPREVYSRIGNWFVAMLDKLCV